MKPVRLRFMQRDASRPSPAGHVPRAAGWAIAMLVVALGTLGAVAWESWQIRAELYETRQALQAMQRPKPPRISAVEHELTTLTSAQWTVWVQMTRQLNTPWSALLDALEVSLPDDIALVAIEPDPSQGGVRLQVEAKSLDTLLVYAGQLRLIPLFDDVNLVKHETNEQDSNRPLRLSLNIRLRAP
jgi:Tfp pilus assembly protein PilN